MHIRDLLQRACPPLPWAEGDNIPWNEPGFSARMLQEHLCQAHDWASRRFATIDRHVDWIHQQLLGGQPARVLDLGCGPGLYSQRLAARGCTCTGIDYSPASIDYARCQAAETGLPLTYHLADLREAVFGEGYDLAMLLYGEPNVFRPADLHHILRRAWNALRPGGCLLLEPHTYAAVEALGHEPAVWSSRAAGLFCERPHLLLHESFWDAAAAAATQRYYVIEVDTGAVCRYAQSLQAYTEVGYHELLASCGFTDSHGHPSLTGEVVEPASTLFALTAHRPPAG